jgi:hypothetical protein
MIADLIGKNPDASARKAEGEKYAESFAADNPRFDRERFLSAIDKASHGIETPMAEEMAEGGVVGGPYEAAQQRKSLFQPGGENDIVVAQSGGKWTVLGAEYDSKSDALDAADSEMHRRYVEFKPHGDIVVKMSKGGIARAGKV